MEKWLLVDGFNLVYRCFFAIPGLSRKDGFPTNAIHGWISSLTRLESDEAPGRMAVCFDLGHDESKRVLLPAYKAQRDEMPSALEQQLPVIRELTEALGFQKIETSGIEADDLLASFAAKYGQDGREILIASADKDLAQCVNSHVKLMLPPVTGQAKGGWRKLDVDGVKARFGVGPEFIPDLLALTGDSSDNIPGVPGVGPKTAAKWIAEFGNLEAVLANTDTLRPPRFQPLLPSLASDLRRNLELVTLRRDCPIPDLLPPGPNPEEILRILEDMEMKTHACAIRERFFGGKEDTRMEEEEFRLH